MIETQSEEGEAMAHYSVIRDERIEEKEDRRGVVYTRKAIWWVVAGVNGEFHSEHETKRKAVEVADKLNATLVLPAGRKAITAVRHARGTTFVV